MGPRLEVAGKRAVKVVDRLANGPGQRHQAIEFGREVCGDLSESEKREWLVTNGIGGFASGTVAGLPTRRYHGLLTASTTPPTGRVLLLSKLEETVVVDFLRQYS